MIRYLVSSAIARGRYPVHGQNVHMTRRSFELE